MSRARDEMYQRLKELSYEDYSRAVQYASGMKIAHDLSLQAAADLECAFVQFALEILGRTGEQK